MLRMAAVADPQTEGLTLFCVNRDLTEPLQVEARLRAFPQLRVLEHSVLRHDDLKAANTAEAPETVTPVVASGATVERDVLRAALPPASWNVVRLARA